MPKPPDRWTVGDAREALWAIQRALGAHVLYALLVEDAEIGISHRLRVETDAGTATTSALPLSPLTLVWLQSAAFELPARVTLHA